MQSRMSNPERENGNIGNTRHTRKTTIQHRKLKRGYTDLINTGGEPFITTDNVIITDIYSCVHIYISSIIN